MPLGFLEVGLMIVKKLKPLSTSSCYSLDSCVIRALDSSYPSSYLAPCLLSSSVELPSEVSDLFSDCSDFLFCCFIEQFHACV